MGNEVMRLRVPQLVGQLKLCLSSLHGKVQSGSGKLDRTLDYYSFQNLAEDW